MEQNKYDGINILIVDDHTRYRNGIISFLKTFSEFRNFSEAENGIEAIEKLKHQKFDIVVLDIQMPVMNGIDAAGIIRKEFPDIKIIILTGIDGTAEMVACMEAGVNAYLLKDFADETLNTAFKKVLQGEDYFPDMVLEAWSGYLKKQSLNTKLASGNTLLSRQELAVLNAVCNEKTTREIADQLFISELTVKRHRSNIMKKLGTDNQVGMVLFAIRNGLFTP